jgi:cell division protein FtsB
MPRERTTRQPAGPGRNFRRPRSPRSPRSASDAALLDAAENASGRRRPRLSPRLKDIGFTRRALVMVGVVAILALTYATSLRIMLNQQRELATTNAQITQRSAQVADLEAQLRRWEDPAYVQSQARAQLGWVMPGEVGYRVIGLDGKIVADVGAGTTITTTSMGDPTRWWDRLAGSVQAADNAR